MLEQLKDRIPEVTDYSTDKILRYQGPRETALQFPYVRVNDRQKVSFLIFDVDRQFVDSGLTPSYIVVTPENQHCHVVYALENPVCSNHEKAWNFMQAVSRIYRSLLDADRVITYQRLLTKNPLHDRWQYIPLTEETCTLTDLYRQAQDLIRVFGVDEKVFSVSFSENSRNCAIFDRLRKSDFNTFNEYLDLAREVNPHIAAILGKPPLSDRELVTIARSVWNYKQRRL